MNHQQHATNPAIINLMVDYLRDEYGPERDLYLWVGKFRDAAGYQQGRAFTSYAQAAAYALSLDVPGCKGVFHQLRLTDEDHGGMDRGTDEADGWLYSFSADGDVHGDGHKNKGERGLPYPPTRERVLELTQLAGLPTPTKVIDSGGGLYPRWIFPERIRSSPEAREMFNALGGHMQAVWEAHGYKLDGTFDVARVLRFPGTHNRKTGDENAPMCKVVPGGSGVQHALTDLLAAAGVAMVQYTTPAAPAAPAGAPAAGADGAPSLFAQPSELGSSILFDDGRKDIWWWREEMERHIDRMAHGSWNANLFPLAKCAARGVPALWTDEQAREYVHGAVTSRYGVEPDSKDLRIIAQGWAAGLADPYTFRPGTETRPADAPKDGEGMSVELAPGILPDSFWESRESLKLIRAVAHSRMTSADAVFGGVLARIAACLPPQCGPDMGVGGPVTSLNSIIALVAPSGGGKSSSQSLIDQLMPDEPQWRPRTLPLGSGEGIAEAYMGMVDEENEDTGKSRKVKKKIYDNVLMVKDEGAELVEIMTGRQGSTIGSVLRAAWSGEDIGQANGKAETTRIVPGGTYSMGMTIGFQPTIAGKLFTPDEIAKGTVQRFLWLNAQDPNIPPPCEDGEDAPEPITARLKLATGTVRDGGPLADMWRDAEMPFPEPRWSLPKVTVPARVRLETRRYVHSVATGQATPDPMDSQRSRHMPKIATPLAIIEGRTDCNDEDFRLAEIIYATSCVNRDRIIRAAKAEREEETVRALALRKRQAAAQEAGRQEQAGSCMTGHLAVLTRKLAASEAGLSRTDIRNGFKHRNCLDDALGQLVDEGVLKLDGRRYFAT